MARGKGHRVSVPCAGTEISVLATLRDGGPCWQTEGGAHRRGRGFRQDPCSPTRSPWQSRRGTCRPCRSGVQREAEVHGAELIRAVGRRVRI